MTLTFSGSVASCVFVGPLRCSSSALSQPEEYWSVPALKHWQPSLSSNPDFSADLCGETRQLPKCVGVQAPQHTLMYLDIWFEGQYYELFRASKPDKFKSKKKKAYFSRMHVKAFSCSTEAKVAKEE